MKAPAACLILPLVLSPIARAGASPPPEDAEPPPDHAVDAARPGPPARPAPALARDEVPGAMRACFGCHRAAVAAYLGHGMARSLGPVGTPAGGTVTNPRSGNRYEIARKDGGWWLFATFPDGGQRAQRLVGRIGAGIADTSWIGAEVDVVSGEDTGRLFFAPVETLTGHGLELSPFELDADSPGLDQAVTADCLTCHTDTDPRRLAGAAVPDTGGASFPFPANALGVGAFEELSPIGCDACHGDPRRHLELMVAIDDGLLGKTGLLRLRDLPAGEQRDVCARCHLQGDVRFELEARRGPPEPGRPLAGRIPVLVPADASDDFRFVGQLERLALSACFRGSPWMTCTTCHLPHHGAAAQGTASFDQACASCHPCGRDPALAVAAVAGGPARTAAGCVDCHVRRAQPFDLPRVRSVDHYIRRRLARPDSSEPGSHRQFADPGGPLEIYDDGRLAGSLATPGGGRWRTGLLAMGLVTLGRIEEAAELFGRFPAPGTPAARRPTAPPELASLETRPSFHQLRAVALLGTGRIESAVAAFSDALELDPLQAGALLGRARLRFDRGDVAGALADTQAVIESHPRSERPWDLRAAMAERLGRPDLALMALEASTRRWPSNAVAWYKLGLLLEQRGEGERARTALARARVLRPSLFSPPAVR